MAAKLAVLDTSVVLMLLFGADAGDERVARVENWVRSLEQNGYQFIIPAAVVVEITSKTSDEVRKALGKFRVEALDYDCALAAARIHDKAIASRPNGTPRSVPKYDTLIAATAHHLGAGILLHVNRSDFKRLLTLLASPTRSVEADKEALLYPIQIEAPGTPPPAPPSKAKSTGKA